MIKKFENKKVKLYNKVGIESGNDEYTFLVKKEKHNEIVIFINNESGYIDVLLKGVDKNGFNKTIYHAKNGYHRFKLDVGFTYKVVFVFKAFEGEYGVYL